MPKTVSSKNRGITNITRNALKINELLMRLLRATKHNTGQQEHNVQLTNNNKALSCSIPSLIRIQWSLFIIWLKLNLNVGGSTTSLVCYLCQLSHAVTVEGLNKVFCLTLGQSTSQLTLIRNGWGSFRSVMRLNNLFSKFCYPNVCFFLFFFSKVLLCLRNNAEFTRCLSSIRKASLENFGQLSIHLFFIRLLKKRFVQSTAGISYFKEKSVKKSID